MPDMPERPDGSGGSSAPRRLSIASVVSGVILGSVLPVVAFAEATAILFGFGFGTRAQAIAFLAVPTIVWLGVAWSTRPVSAEVSRLSAVELAALVLFLQLIVAIVVSGVIAAVRARRGSRGV